MFMSKNILKKNLRSELLSRVESDNRSSEVKTGRNVNKKRKKLNIHQKEKFMLLFTVSRHFEYFDCLRFRVAWASIFVDTTTTRQTKLCVDNLHHLPWILLKWASDVFDCWWARKQKIPASLFCATMFIRDIHSSTNKI